MRNNLTVSSSPHLHSGITSQSIMLDVIIALIPATFYGVFIFGWRAAVLVAVCVGTSVLSEFLWNKILKKPNSLGDLTAIVTGLLLALNLPSSLPFWMAAVGSAVAIIVVKQMFGGVGHNFANPAITARIVLMVSFPAAMTKFFDPFVAVTSPTPLADATKYTINKLFFGMHPGTIGETSAILLIIGGIYLILRRVISPIIPAAFIGTVFLFSWILGANPFTAIFSGGLLLGAFFMATDYVTSPTFNWGKLIFGIGCGIITVVIRHFAALPEGVSYSILVMNLLVPHINTVTTPKPFGWEAKKK